MQTSEQIGHEALIGASIPRSGHHFLARILNFYFGSEIHYCEWYGPPNCCRQVPCTRRSGNRITYQKSHDWDFTLTKDVGEALYVIQYRQPVPEALSDRDLLQDAFNAPSLSYRLSREYYGWWLAGKAIYYRKFHKKYFENRITNAVYLDYEPLVKQSVEAISPIIQWAAGSVDEERLAQAIAQASPSRDAGPGAPAFSPRVIEKSRHYDRDLLAPFEAYVLEHCPLLEFQSELGGSYKDHWLYGLILIQDPEEPLPAGETDRLDAAAKFAPNHPEITSRLARRELEKGAPERAIAMLEATITEHPFFGQAYRIMVDACKASGQSLPSVCLESDALYACTETPGVLVEIANVMLSEEKIGNAVAALSLAAVIQPDNFRTHHLLARALVRLGRWSQARPHAERAAEMKPGHDQNARLLGRIVEHLGPRG